MQHKLSPAQREQFEQQVRTGPTSAHVLTTHASARSTQHLCLPRDRRVRTTLRVRSDRFAAVSNSSQGWVICKNVFDVADDFGPLQKFVGAVMDEVCDAEIAAGNMTEAQAFRNSPFDQRLALIHAEGEKLGTTVAGAVYGAISVGGRGGELLNLLRHPNLLSLVTDLLGPDIIGSSVFRIRPKVPRHERGEVPWHQDSGRAPSGTKACGRSRATRREP